MATAAYHFPADFLWGTATSAHQVEGGNVLNDWAAWELEPGRIQNGDTAGLACDWWGGRWQQDFDLAAAAGQSAHRLSVEWSRIEPAPGQWDMNALDAYREIIKGARQRGLEPMVTLHHFTNPLWFAEGGGWLSPEAPAHFETYAAKVVAALGDLSKFWITLNEPNVLLAAAYLHGIFPPGERDIRKVFQAARQMILAHAAAYQALHLARPDARVGIAHHYRAMLPAHRLNPLERAAARVRNQIFNHAIAAACIDGHLRLLGSHHTIPQAAGTQDFIGVNYYTGECFRFDPFHPLRLLEGESNFPAGCEISPGGFIANYPAGLWRALDWARRFSLPVYITENGIEDITDRIRPRYLLLHLHQVWRAINCNWPIYGYFHWSLVDNFEWERGWSQRWGLWGLNRETQERVERRSARLYAEICTQNALTSETTARYASQCVKELFPDSGLIELPSLRKL
jgi:beta-glucosidase